MAAEISKILNYTVDLNADTEVQGIANWVAGDQIAHTLRVTVMDNGAAANLTGVTAGGAVIRPDDSTVPVEGTISGNVMTLRVPAAAYSMSGRINVLVRLNNGSEMRTILMLTTLVMRGDSDDVVVATTSLETLSGLLSNAAKIDDNFDQKVEELKGIAATTLTELESDVNTKLGEAQTAADGKLAKLNSDINTTFSNADNRHEQIKSAINTTLANTQTQANAIAQGAVDTMQAKAETFTDYEGVITRLSALEQNPVGATYEQAMQYLEV